MSVLVQQWQQQRLTSSTPNFSSTHNPTANDISTPGTTTITDNKTTNDSFAPSTTVIISEYSISEISLSYGISLYNVKCEGKFGKPYVMLPHN